MLKVEDPYASMEKDQLISMIHFLADSSNEKVALLQKIDDLMPMIFVSNKVR